MKSFFNLFFFIIFFLWIHQSPTHVFPCFEKLLLVFPASRPTHNKFLFFCLSEEVLILYFYLFTLDRVSHIPDWPERGWWASITLSSCQKCWCSLYFKSNFKNNVHRIPSVFFFFGWFCFFLLSTKYFMLCSCSHDFWESVSVCCSSL